MTNYMYIASTEYEVLPLLSHPVSLVTVLKLLSRETPHV